ncbi:DUF368 domain-containing protein [Halorubrum vacuolatum]|uniref:Putative membrane protein n=1 Tax=Halorubrum vacuolatum TaxID=63740 RepID=A0A238UPL7_HALVU|nr:DUF368 domain-containing protein [Halorubrum vacuolatum]SNR23894.1 putative membrane protein [Halorubrum vacuolatum]
MGTVRAWLVVYLKGLAMGSADAVPGVSGGTIALIAGIYERLIAALTAIDPERIGRVLAGVRRARVPDARAAFREMDGGFLLVLGAGIATAVVAVLSAVDLLLQTVPVATFGFFFGLIAASAVVLFGEVDLSTPGRKGAAAAGFLAAFLTSGYASTALGNELPVVFLAGAVAVSAMILPGISGSLLLIVLGQYDYMSGTLRSFLEALFGTVTSGAADVPTLMEFGTPVVVFLSGAVVGLFTVAHAVRRALAAYRMATLAFLVSLIVGALRAPIVEVSIRLGERGETWGAAAPRFLAAALGGALIVLLLDRHTATIEY